MGYSRKVRGLQGFCPQMGEESNTSFEMQIDKH